MSDKNVKAKTKEIKVMREAMQKMCNEIINNEEVTSDDEPDTIVDDSRIKKNGAVHPPPAVKTATSNRNVKYKQGFLAKYT